MTPSSITKMNTQVISGMQSNADLNQVSAFSLSDPRVVNRAKRIPTMNAGVASHLNATTRNNGMIGEINAITGIFFFGADEPRCEETFDARKHSMRGRIPSYFTDTFLAMR